jgi:hypothetical protein
MVLGLHRAVTREIAASYRKRVNAGECARERRPLELREAAAQLEAELYECPTPARLREFWSLGGFLGPGVLFPPDASNERRDQGLRELLAVTGVCEAYCRISGTLTFKTDRNTDDSHHQQVAASTETKGQDVFGPALALLAGGLAGTAALTSQTTTAALGATAVGLVTALAAGAVIKATSTRSRKRTMTRDYSFLADLSLSTLDRALPMLIERLQAAGLAPLFVVDELDKVEDLPERIFGMVRHLKKLVSENAFFCFLTDRGYFESVMQKNMGQPFPVESTYYTHRMFVVFRHDDMHRFLRSLLVQPDAAEVHAGPYEAHGLEAAAGPLPFPARPGDEEAVQEDMNDWRVLPLVLLHRSQLHTLEMWRQLAAWRSMDGTVVLGRGLVRTSLMYRLELAMQVAVELMLARSPLKERLEREPEFRRLMHDALYYPSRQWLREPEKDLDLGAGEGAARFGKYLEERTGAAEQPQPQGSAGASAPAQLISADDRAFLLSAVREMCELLSVEGALTSAFATEWEGYDADPRENELTKRTIGEALPPAKPAILQNTATHRFQWSYGPTGLPRHLAPAFFDTFDAASTQYTPWEQDAVLIETIETFLAGL